jgi:hypothetical protein
MTLTLACQATLRRHDDVEGRCSSTSHCRCGDDVRKEMSEKKIGEKKITSHTIQQTITREI